MSSANLETVALQEAIERLYSMFKRYRLKSPVDGCASKEEIARLESKPLRQLLAADFGRYLHSALTTWGSLEDFKHFVPRIYELRLAPN